MSLYDILTKILYEKIDLDIYNEVNNYIINNLNNNNINRETKNELLHFNTSEINSVVYYWSEILTIEYLVKEWNTINSYKLKIKY